MKKKAHTGEHRTIAANLHLKRNTKGTSNELSLSVLGGLSVQKDEEDVSPTSRASLCRFPTVGTEAPRREIVRSRTLKPKSNAAKLRAALGA